MIPIAGPDRGRPTQGPTKVNRYQMYPSADLNGFTIPSSSVPARRSSKMDELAKRDLPPGLKFEWTDMAYQQKQASETRGGDPRRCTSSAGTPRYSSSV